MEYRISVDNDTKLYSGWNYGDFRQIYAEKLWQYAENRSDHVYGKRMGKVCLLALQTSIDHMHPETRREYVPTAYLHIGADVSEWLAYFAVIVICHVCLFAPKNGAIGNEQVCIQEKGWKEC